MSEETLLPLAIVGVSLVVMIAIGFLVVTRFFRRAPAHHVLVRNGAGGPRISTEGIVAFPFLHTIDVLDVSVRTIAIERRSGKGLLTENGDRIELKATFFVKVNGTVEDMLCAAKELGCAVANDPERFRKHVEPKLVNALETVARMLSALEIEKHRDRFRDEVIAVIGDPGSGLRIEDLALEDVRVVPDIAPPYR